MPTAEVIRHYHASPTETATSCGTVELSGPNPITPTRVRHALRDITLSSPLGNYEVSTSTNPASLTIDIKHPLNDRMRVGARASLAKDLADMKKQLDKINKERDEEKKVRDEEKKERDEEKRKRDEEKQMIAKWETCSRISQAINDFILRSVKNSNDAQLKKAKYISKESSKGQRNRYLPHLFTVWWFKWNMEDPDKYPLSTVFSSLTDEEVDQYRCKTLGKDFDNAATALWDVKYYNPLLLLMLHLYHSRPKGRNECQHPPPTSSFAQSFLPSLPLSKQHLSAALLIINSGTKTESGKLQRFFEHEDGRNAMDKDRIELDAGLEKWLKDVQKASASEPEEGDTQREHQTVEEGHRRASKRVKHNPPA